MLKALAQKIFGTQNQRELKRMRKTIEQINALEENFESLSDAELQQKTPEFKQRIADGESLNKLLPEAFALVREASKRTLGLRHFDVQMMGGITLHQGNIAEMRTGEGKTLVATLPVYLNGLTGRGVYVVTVNDYLATRDANTLRPLYEFLGLTVGTVVPNMDIQSKRDAYNCDITYGTNNEFGFDYLRDNMAFSLDDRVQREQFFAIVDEVDSILIDEARTPLIISGASEDSSELYMRINRFAPYLKRAEVTREHGEEVVGEGDYVYDEKNRHIDLTEQGHEAAEKFLVKEGLLKEGESLYDAGNLKLLHHVHAAVKAHVMYQVDIDYIVEDNQVVLIDEHTGRTMQGRRLSEGLHQAIEAKEGVNIQSESQTLASTTFQNYFRLFDKLAGMTGTADTEAAEFHQIYNLSVTVIPTNRPVARKDLNDVIYMTVKEKFEAIAKDVEEISATGAPILVGTASIESSEVLSKLLTRKKIKHEVLNAKYHEREAEIIADAGRPGAVTIATNMAGRGTDIVLGGSLEAELAKLDNPSQAEIDQRTEKWRQRHQQVLDAGGLHILGSERHESRRIDNQLRGRAGRQGDPGVTRFYLSLEDDLMRIFASERMRNMMQALGMKDGEAIEHRMVSNAIEKAQRKVEGRNFDIRKSLLEYDDVANDQRQVIYSQRDYLLNTDDLSDMIDNIREDVVESVISTYIPPQSLDEMWDVAGLERTLELDFGLPMPVAKWLEEDEKLHEEGLRQRILETFKSDYQAKCDAVGDEMRRFEKHMILQILDAQWKEHLAAMDQLRMGIHLRGYAGKDPKQEYKRESFEMFEIMLDNIKYDAIKLLARVRIQTEEEIAALEAQRRAEQAKEKLEMKHQDPSSAGQEGNEREAAEPQQPFVRDGRKIGRNEACPCGSGKKYKHCHGALN